jgi:Alkylated DNA repair protein
MNLNFFAHGGAGGAAREPLGPGALLLRGFALPVEAALLQGLEDVTATSPFRQMETPGGYRMSVGMTNCGPNGWVTDESGYRYQALDPLSGKEWPPMPESFLRLARAAAAEAGFSDFEPDACLVNRYEPGSRLTLHQDKNERDFRQPIVSISLGLPAIFLFGGMQRSERQDRLRLWHGDVLVWGGPDRLRYHGVMPLKDGWHPTLGRARVNLTFRRAQ